jgi:hypothetical protein
MHLQDKLVIRQFGQDDLVVVGHGGAPKRKGIAMLHGAKATRPLFGKRHTPDESRQKVVALGKGVAHVP